MGGALVLHVLISLYATNFAKLWIGVDGLGAGPRYRARGSGLFIPSGHGTGARASVTGPGSGLVSSGPGSGQPRTGVI